MTSEDVLHSGVKGMKWGVRRAENNKRNSGYSSKERTKDSLRFTSGGIKRINKRMNKGADLKTARRKEGQRTALKAAAIVAIYNSPKIIDATLNAVDKYGGALASSVAQKAETNRGRAQAAGTMGLPQTASTGPNYAQNSGGAYKISDL